MVIFLIEVTAGFSLFAQENNFINESSKNEIIVKFKYSSKFFSAPSNGADSSSQKVIGNRTAEKLFKNISIKNSKLMGAPGLGTADLSEIYKIKISPDEKIENVMADIKKNPDIEYVEPNFSFELLDVPDDKYFELQWGLRNTGQSIDSVTGYCGADIEAEEAWNVCKGTSGIVIALIDTGIDYNHPDLAKNIWTNTSEIPGNGIDEDNNGYTDDFRGWSFFDQNDNVLDTNSHGTHCAGIISAEADNGIGIAGVCWNAKLMPIKVFPNNSNYTNAETCARAILYAVDNGAKIISASWGSTNNSNLLNDAVKYANDRGVIMVFAAGNNNSSQSYYPAANPLVISVGATDNKDIKASFSNYGDWIDVFAPGVDIYSTLPNNNYGSKSGTSSSCPFVAGVAGLMLSKYPNLSPAEVKQNIKEKADWIGFLNNNTAKRRVNAFRSLGIYESYLQIAPAQDASEIIAYPNPLYTAKYPVVKIGKIPLGLTDIKILIFNVAGELVKTLSEGTEIKTLGTEKLAEWNATNDSGQNVASGVYIYVLRSGDSKQKSGKIAVLR